MTDRPVVGEPVPSPAPKPEAPRWGMGDVAIGLAVGFVVSQLVLGLWIGVSGDDEESLGLLVVSLLGLWLGLGGTVLFASRRKGTGSLVDDFGLRVEKSDIGLGLVVGVLSQVVVVPLLYLPLHLLGADLDVSEKARETTDLASGAGIAVLAVAIVFGAPLVEELFYRGLFLRSATRRLGPRWAIALSAFTFALTHFQPVQFLGLLAFGVILAVLVDKKGRLGPAVVAHMAFNATTVAILIATR